MRHTFSFLILLLLAAMLCAGCAGDVPAEETGTTAASTPVDTTVADTTVADTTATTVPDAYEAEIDFSDLP